MILQRPHFNALANIDENFLVVATTDEELALACYGPGRAQMRRVLPRHTNQSAYAGQAQQ